MRAVPEAEPLMMAHGDMVCRSCFNAAMIRSDATPATPKRLHPELRIVGAILLVTGAANAFLSLVLMAAGIVGMRMDILSSAIYAGAAAMVLIPAAFVLKAFVELVEDMRRVRQLMEKKP